MNQTELIITIASSIVSWNIFDVIKKKIERDKNLGALKSIFTVCASVALIAATGAFLYLGYHRIRQATEPPKAEPPPQTRDPQVASVQTTTPQSPSASQRAFRSRLYSKRRPAQSSAPATSQDSNAPTTAPAGQASEVAQPAPGQSPQSPATEMRPLFKTEPPAPGCVNPTPPPATIIFPPGEKGPEENQLV